MTLPSKADSISISEVPPSIDFLQVDNNTNNETLTQQFYKRPIILNISCMGTELEERP